MYIYIYQYDMSYIYILIPHGRERERERERLRVRRDAISSEGGGPQSNVVLKLCSTQNVNLRTCQKWHYLLGIDGTTLHKWKEFLNMNGTRRQKFHDLLPQLDELSAHAAMATKKGPRHVRGEVWDLCNMRVYNRCSRGRSRCAGGCKCM